MSKSTASFTVFLLAVVFALAFSQPASAATVFATSINTGQIYSVDTVTHSVTSVVNTGAALDSLFFDPSGRIIYSQLNNARVLAYNPQNNTNTVLATGLASPIDLALEPSLTSFLTSNSGSNSLSRVSLAGGVLGAALPLGGRPDGIIYDGSGRLFVNVSTGFTANDTTVEQINPTTGAVLAHSANTGVFLDGLTYDSFSGMLFASDYNNGRILRLNPNTLAFTILTPSGAALSQPDGITSDGMGNLYIASRANSQVVQYVITTNTATDVGTINGLDDLAPASGLGSNPVPEPSTLFMAGIGAVVFLGYRLRRVAGRLAPEGSPRKTA